MGCKFKFLFFAYNNCWKFICNKQNIELCFNDIKLMLFWNGVNVIGSAKIRNGQFWAKWGKMGNFWAKGGEMGNFWVKWAR